MDILRNRVALITGAGQNIGEAIARKLAQKCAAVILNGRTMSKLERVAKQINNEGGNAFPVVADISDVEQIDRLIAVVETKFGGIDIVVSNVGQRPKISFEELTPDKWDELIKVNLSSAFYISHKTVPYMKNRRWGRFVFVSGYDGFWAHITGRAYNIAAKSGLHGLAKAMGRELGPIGITANTVVPGAIDTERDWSQYPNVTKEDKAKMIPVRRWGKTEDIAEGVLYLCCNDFINGQTLHLNGGEFMF